MIASILLQSCFAGYLSTPCSQNCQRNNPYSCKVLKTFNCHLDHKHKFTKVTGNTLHVHFDRPYWRKILSLYYVSWGKILSTRGEEGEEKGGREGGREDEKFIVTILHFVTMR